MYNDENIKKLVEDAIKNMDPNGEFFKNVVSQITEQIKNEQKKISEPKISKKLGDKADTYLKNNKSLDEYISNRDKFMGVFDKITKDKVEKDLEEFEKNYNDIVSKVEEDNCCNCNTHCDHDCDYNDEDDYCSYCECKDECDNDTTNISYTSYTTGCTQTTNKDGDPIGYLYFNFNSNSDHPDTYKQILDYYSILTLHADEWDNWNHDSEDNIIQHGSLSLLMDSYNYTFEDYERGLIDSGGDIITSFIYTKLDDDLKMFSIYILNYSRETNKLYDFTRFIITPPEKDDDVNMEIYYMEFYYNYLKRYFEDANNTKKLLEDYLYTYINIFKVNHHLPVKEEEDMYVLLQGDILHQIISKIDSVSKKVEIKKEDTPDKTNSILDKLGIPHDDKGNVEIPIGDTFTNARASIMNDASNFLKSWFDFDEETDIGDTEAKNKSSNEYTINTGNKYYDDFLSKAINDGYIAVEFLSPESVHLNINGTYVFMKNPYTEK